jgi:aminopeptidase-like protein
MESKIWKHFPPPTRALSVGVDDDPAVLSQELEELFDRLWPLPRSAAGPGLFDTQRILSEYIPLRFIEVPSGTKVFDWTVPEAWTLREAYVIDPHGRRILDAAVCNLHIVSHSEPFRGTLTREELDKHLYSRDDLPDAVPYIISYYRRRWGFCISHKERLALPEGEYQVVVDTDLRGGDDGGCMTLAECVLPGESDEEVFLSTYTCHPSMANNELSGPLVAVLAYHMLAARPRRRVSYRFFFGTETIGALTYASLRHETLKKMLGGLVLTCIGDRGPFHYKMTRRPTTTDRAARHVLEHWDGDSPVLDLGEAIHPWWSTGSDERQYCAPGLNYPMGSLYRTMYGLFPEYHTHLDDKSFISFPAMAESAQVVVRIATTLGANRRYINCVPFGEPMLGPRGLYPSVGALLSTGEIVEARMFVLAYSDGESDLLDIAERAKRPMHVIVQEADTLLAKGVIRLATADDTPGVCERAEMIGRLK